MSDAEENNDYDDYNTAGVKDDDPAMLQPSQSQELSLAQNDNEQAALVMDPKQIQGLPPIGNNQVIPQSQTVIVNPQPQVQVVVVPAQAPPPSVAPVKKRKQRKEGEAPEFEVPKSVKDDINEVRQKMGKKQIQINAPPAAPQNEFDHQFEAKPEGEEESESELEVEDLGQPISYEKLQSHITQMHPRNENAEKFSVCSHLGGYENTYFKLDCMMCCRSKVSELSQEINIGPTMLLMSTKQIMKFFFLLSVLNIPLFTFFYQSDQHIDDCSDLICYFSHLGIGTLGERENACGYANTATQTNITMKCAHKMGKIDNLMFVGMAKNDSITCGIISENTYRTDAPAIFEKGCFTHWDLTHRQNSVTIKEKNLLQNENKVDDFLEYFKETCYGKNECTLPVEKLMMRNQCKSKLQTRVFNSEYYKNDLDCTGRDSQFCTKLTERQKAEPVMMAVAMCEQEEVDISVGYGDTTYAQRTITTDQFTILVVVIDIVMIILLFLFYSRLDEQQRQFFEKYDAETIQMIDFSMMVANLPDDEYFYGDEDIFRIRLWSQMEDILKDMAVREGYFFGDFSGTQFQISDITFARSTMTEANILDKYVKKKKQIVFEKRRQEKYDPEETTFSCGACATMTKRDNSQRKIDKMYKDLDKIKMEFYAKSTNQRRQSKVLKVSPESNSDLLRPQSYSGSSMVFAFVTFRSMKGQQLFNRAYEEFNSKSKRCCYLTCGCCCPRDREHLKRLYIGNKWPSMKEAILPDNIYWENLSVGWFSRFIRGSISKIIGLAILIGAIVSILGLSSAKDLFENDFRTPAVCPNPKKLTKEKAVLDHLSAKPKGYMHCYCYDQVVEKQNTDALDITFEPYSSDNICQDWFYNYYGKQVATQMQSVSVVLINIIATVIFELLGAFQKFYTKNEKTLTIMSNILILQYVNFAIVPLLVKFNLDIPFINRFGLLKGPYTDFSVQWYKDVGATLCFTMLLNTITPHLGKIFLPILKCLLRWRDRNYSAHILDDNDNVQTKKVLQEDVEKVYTGDEIQSYHLYAQVFTSFLVTMTYSAGLPMLYPIAYLNFVILFWVYKTLLIKFYQKTIAFNQDLPFYTIRYFKVAFVLHLIMALFMYSNRDILSSETLAQYTEEGLDVASDVASDAAADQGSDIAGVDTAAVQQYTDLNNLRQNRWADRFTQPIPVVYILFFVLISIYYLFKSTIIGCFTKCWDKCCEKSKKEKQEEEQKQAELNPSESLFALSKDYYAELKLGPLYQFFLRSEKEYRSTLGLKEANCPKEVDNQMLRDVKKRLKKRIELIKDRFNKHLALVMKEVNPNPKDPMIYEGINLKELSTKSKYKLCQINEWFLLRRKMKEKLNILRMKGITQSYYMYDSQLYKNSKAALDEILEDNK